MPVPEQSAQTMDADVVEWMPLVEITDPQEIAELCALMDYEEFCRSDRVFREGYVEISYLDKEGEEHTGYLDKGALPEKYILRFGDCS